MVPPRSSAHAVALALFFSALLMAGLAAAFWTGVIDVGETREIAAGVVGLAAVADIGLGLYFFTRAKS